GAEAPTNINDHGSSSAAGVVATMARTMATAGNNNLYWLGETFLVIGPEHAETLARDGYTKEMVAQALHRLARVPVSEMSERQFAHIESWIAAEEKAAFVDEDGRVALVRSPTDIHIVVAGGPGKHSMWIPTWFRSETRPLTTRAGRPLSSIAELRR